MKRQENSDSRTDATRLLEALKSRADQVGLTACWRYRKRKDGRLAPDRDAAPGDNLFVLNAPVPLGVPVDSAVIRLTVRAQLAHFEMTLSLNPVELRQAQEPHEFLAVRERHELEWFPRLASYFDEICLDYSLSWDVEYDEVFEDALSVTFPVARALNSISALFRDLATRARRM